MTDKPNDSIETLVWTTAKASELLSKVILALSNETNETYSFVTQTGDLECPLGLVTRASLGISIGVRVDEQFGKLGCCSFREVLSGKVVDMNDPETFQKAASEIAALVDETCRSKKAERIEFEIHVPNADPYLASPIGTIVAYKEIE